MMMVTPLQRYRQHTVLGSGQSSTAYQCVETASERSCLLLLLRLPAQLEQQARKRFLERFERMTAQLRAVPAHPALIPLRDAGVWRDTPYLVFPEAALHEQMPLAVHTPQQTMHILHMVAQAVEHLHDHEVIHGNLGWASLLQSSTSAFSISLAGCGLRAILEAQGIERGDMAYAHLRTLWGTYLGDPSTLAPECLLGQPPDRFSDMYALGKLGCQLLCGKQFALKEENNPYLELAMSNLYQSVTLPSGILAQTAAVLTRLTTLRRDERFGTMHDVVAAFVEIQNGE